MNTIVLAYSGGFRSSNAVHWLSETTGADVVTLTLDIGQREDLPAIRSRALSCGARRAHAIDAREELVREFLLPSLEGGPCEPDAIPLVGELPAALIARKLLEVARIEGASMVAHAAVDQSIDAAFRALDSGITMLAPAREWQMDPAELATYARTRGMAPRDTSNSDCRIDENLWGRTISFRDGDGRPKLAHRLAASTADAAHLEIRFESGVPVAINDVPMPPVEVLESLALIAGRHGVGHLETSGDGRTIVYDAPAATVLHTARAALGEQTGVVYLNVVDGQCAVLDPNNTEVVNLA
jgi:argininosuccinate synthase